MLPDPRFAVTSFQHKFDNVPVLSRPGGWSQFVELLVVAGHDVRDKKDGPLLCPTEYMEGTKRANENALRVHFGVLDIDESLEADVLHVLGRLDTLGIEYLFATTHRYRGEGIYPDDYPEEKLRGKEMFLKCRILMPFDRAILFSEWDKFWERMVDYCGATGMADTARRDLQGMYYYPSVDPKFAHLATIQYTPGNPLVASTILGHYIAPETITPSIYKPFDTQKLRNKLRTLEKKNPELASRFSLVLNGEPFAEIGEVDTTLTSMTGWLSQAFTEADPAALAALFSLSIAAMLRASPESHTLEEVKVKIERFREADVKLKAEQKQDAEEEATRERLLKTREAFQEIGIDREHPYTPEEIEVFNISEHHWLIEHGGEHYLFFNGDYIGPFGPTNTVQAMHKYYAPAYSAGVDTFKFNPKSGQHVPLTLNEFIYLYGTNTTKAPNYSYISQTSRYNPQTGLKKSTARIRVDLVPTYSPETDKWLRLLAGDQAELLMDWLAGFADLSRLWDALYLNGIKGAGKTTFCEGLAHLFDNGGFVSASEILVRTFRESLLRMPVIVASEDFPPDQGANLRDLLGAKTHEIERKNRTTVQLEGCVRVIICANDTDLYERLNVTTQEQADAMAERIFPVNIPKGNKASDYMASPEFQQVYNYVQSIGLAQHTLWLRDNRPIERPGRFMKRSHNKSFANTVINNGPQTSTVLEWLVGFLKKPQLDRRLFAEKPGAIVFNGRLLVQSSGIAAQWNLVDTGRKGGLDVRQIKNALKVICQQDRLSGPVGEDGKREKYRVVRREQLQAWCEENDAMTVEELDLRLGKEIDHDE